MFLLTVSPIGRTYKCDWGWQGKIKKLVDRGAYLLKNLPFPADIVFEVDNEGAVETNSAHK
ncbi:hypothetical protein RvY_00860 [Ramazzottius varieornatus]|uniref:Uncharacterized protein n=1 Tax=Ramazzottius varieornatus TaxID=947166 RepID=A0A1D1UE91_RAMVA|nr:hypothetical protein RvY_00860 [Ramazzottius varieornatus]